MVIEFIGCDECHDIEKKNLMELRIGGNYITLCPDCAMRLKFYLDEWFDSLNVPNVLEDDDLIGKYNG